jgi:hypothetical protein
MSLMSLIAIDGNAIGFGRRRPTGEGQVWAGQRLLEPEGWPAVLV